MMTKGIIAALGAAITFGISTPFAKLLVGDVPPVLLAGLLYLGAALGLGLWGAVRRVGSSDNTITGVRIQRADVPWLAGAVLFGGIAGPMLLMLGLSTTTGSAAALLLNLEGVFTALIAWMVFKEHTDRRIMLGMLLIVAAGMLLGAREGHGAVQNLIGPLAVTAACLCWAIDNNFTRKISACDAVTLANIKGVVAGSVNTSIAVMFLGTPLPSLQLIGGALIVGAAGYGISLVLFIVALRHLGTARTGAYFSSATFIGAATAVLLLHERQNLMFWVAALLIGIGLWLHLSERHAHAHTHDPGAHDHWHDHDELHQHEHAHDFSWDSRKAHSHSHLHKHLTHTHAHFPDMHHQHSH